MSIENRMRELELPAEEVVQTTAALRRLAEWRVPDPDPVDMAQLTRRLQAITGQPEPSFVNQITATLAIARLQVGILRPQFWLTSAAVVAVGALAVLVRPDAQRLLLYLLGPLLGFCAVASAFSGSGQGLLECELACPPSPRQLLVARLVVVLAYTMVLGLCLTMAAGWAGAGELTLSWLAPLLVEVGLTLLLSLRISAERAAAIVYAAWATILVAAWSIGAAALHPGTFVNLLLGVVGLCAVAAAVYALPTRLDRQLGRPAA